MKSFWTGIGMLAWLLTSLGAMHLGLLALGYNVFALPLFMTTLSSWVKPIHYVIGAAGLYSFVLYLMKVSCCSHHSCDSCK